MTDKEILAANRLKGMLDWSDRIGSDEIFEIQSIIRILEKDEVQGRS